MPSSHAPAAFALFAGLGATFGGCSIVIDTAGLTPAPTTPGELDSGGRDADAPDGDPATDAPSASDGQQPRLDAQAEAAPPFCTGVDLFCDSFDDPALRSAPFGWTSVAGSVSVVSVASAPSPGSAFRVDGAGTAAAGGTVERTRSFAAIVIDLDVRLGANCLVGTTAQSSTLVSAIIRVPTGVEDVRFGYSGGRDTPPSWTMWEKAFAPATVESWEHVKIEQTNANIKITVSGADNGNVTNTSLSDPFTSFRASFGTPEIVDLATCTVLFDNVRINVK